MERARARRRSFWTTMRCWSWMSGWRIFSVRTEEGGGARSVRAAFSHSQRPSHCGPLLTIESTGAYR